MAGSGCNAYQIRKIYAIGGALGMVKRNEEDDLLHELVEGMTGKKSIKALTYGEAWTECHNDIKAIQRNFLTKEDYFREQAKTEKKLDQILNLLMKGRLSDE